MRKPSPKGATPGFKRGRSSGALGLRPSVCRLPGVRQQAHQGLAPLPQANPEPEPEPRLTKKRHTDAELSEQAKA
jgi:hypothetical protein